MRRSGLPDSQTRQNDTYTNCVPQEARKERITENWVCRNRRESHFQPEFKILVYSQNLEQKVVRKECEITCVHVCVILLHIQVCL